jgi:hypothetical protein
MPYLQQLFSTHLCRQQFVHACVLLGPTITSNMFNVLKKKLHVMLKCKRKQMSYLQWGTRCTSPGRCISGMEDILYRGSRDNAPVPSKAQEVAFLQSIQKCCPSPCAWSWQNPLASLDSQRILPTTNIYIKNMRPGAGCNARNMMQLSEPCQYHYFVWTHSGIAPGIISSLWFLLDIHAPHQMKNGCTPSANKYWSLNQSEHRVSHRCQEFFRPFAYYTGTNIL